ncbi:hypothetical protein M2D07_014305 [Pseudomonas sp. BGr12]|uniref:hypothetical protein n=1 Tax=Pseudomonas sp. BGr12 TaxID=2936269 RepID=UPI002559D9BD|nr:hypothetical protein [Pseudomonas sp. BJa5]MDL2428186.1 hypothetical protein [Pseudomonas sp. BJa5]
MGLDLHIEADDRLTTVALCTALERSGAIEIDCVRDTVEAHFASGMRLSADAEDTDFNLYAEDKKGLDFKVSMCCCIRIKGPEPEGESSMSELEKIAESIADVCSSYFILSFQYESTLFWRDALGLHCA